MNGRLIIFVNAAVLLSCGPGGGNPSIDLAPIPDQGGQDWTSPPDEGVVPPPDVPKEVAKDVPDAKDLPSADVPDITEAVETGVEVPDSLEGPDDQGSDVPDLPNPADSLCKPCITDDDCTFEAGWTGQCLDQGSEGRFCGKDCSDAAPCPKGYVCSETGDSRNEDSKQCVPADGKCDCTDAFATAGFKTVCYVSNLYGLCQGESQCAAGGGMTPCTAKTPGPEACNLADDDCDGKTDEDIAAQECEKKSGQTACKGPLVCEDGEMVCKAPDPSGEACDGLDNDCDGKTDEEGASGCVDYWFDGDADSYGMSAPFCLCAPVGKVTATQGGDCDDSDAAVNPAAKEVCNGHDDDCDGAADEEGAAGCSQFWIDADKDGYGPAGGDACLCEPTPDHPAVKGGDCDDSNPSITTGLVEQCDGLDNDCDGVTDNPGSMGCGVLYRDGDGDGFGVGEDALCLCGPEGAYTSAVSGDCDDGDVTAFPGAAEGCNGKDDDCDGATDESGSEGCGEFLLDADGDGLAAPGAPGKCLCGPEPPYTASGAGDCDDQNKTVFPGAEEACNGHDDDCDEVTDPDGSAGCIQVFRDEDGDGFGQSGDGRCMCKPAAPYTAEAGGDCDDADPAVNGGKAEECGNGKDDDCDGLIDEEGAAGCKEFWRDADLDGWGGTGDSKCLCAPLAPYTAVAQGDCDDSNAKAYPGAVESCGDGEDNDCDGSADEEGASGCKTYIEDKDGDGWGKTGTGKCLCAPAAPYTAVAQGDCDDSDPAVSPWAKEACNGKDDDCDGKTDEEGASGCDDFFRDADGDGFGVTGDSRCLCGADVPYGALQGGDCDDSEPKTNPGAAETCNGKDDDCDGVADNENSAGCKTFFFDGDGDGWGKDGQTKCLCKATGKFSAQGGGDCNDTDATANPGKKEQCGNNKDDDCDGKVDEEGAEGCDLFFMDMDGDGYGTAESKCLCAPSGSFKADMSGDCDDKDPGVNPGVKEVCGNGRDDDCSGGQDEEGAKGCVQFYLDLDGDGWGTSGKCLCAASGGYTAAQGGDCDDADTAVRPGLNEVCGNGKDDNCNGTDNEQDASKCTVYHYDGDGDGWGLAQAQCWCVPTGKFTTLKTLDCDDTDPGVNPGATEKCNGHDDDCDGGLDEQGASGCITYYTDIDGDKWGAGVTKCLCKAEPPLSAVQGGDCNDGDATVNPGAAEKCNGVDDDCDGGLDEAGAQGCKTYFHDVDNDKYGTTQSQCLCAASGNYRALQAGDCDDMDPAVKPGATEKCNAIDDNCNGQTDEGQGLPGCKTYYYDSDGDNFGTGAAQCLCAASDLYRAVNPNDCDDNDKDVYPNALEICNGKDDNCNFQVDEGQGLPGCKQFHYDFDNDSWGLATSFQCLCTTSGYYRATKGGDCNDQDPAVNPGAAESCDLKDNDCDGSVDEGFDGFPESWPGPGIGAYPGQPGGSVTETITPKGDQDWMSVTVKEADTVNCKPIQCKVDLKGIPVGQDYDLCVCWSTSKAKCDLVPAKCSQKAGNADESVQLALPETGCPTAQKDNGKVDEGYCDIQVAAPAGGGASCIAYNLTWAVWE